jgi:hypothetical protein
MKEIGFLNHHIRNAMQLIELADSNIKDPKERTEVVDRCVRRVVETLRRVSRESDELKLDDDHLSGVA